MEFASTGTQSRRYAGQQMGVKAGEYCVLKLTVIHNTSAQIAESPSLYQREGGGRWEVGVGRGAVSKGCCIPGNVNTALSVT